MLQGVCGAQKLRMNLLTLQLVLLQAFEAIHNISKECQASLLAYVRTISIDVITPVQVGKMYVEASPFIMDPVKLGAYLSAFQLFSVLHFLFRRALHTCALLRSPLLPGHLRRHRHKQAVPA